MKNKNKKPKPAPAAEQPKTKVEEVVKVDNSDCMNVHEYLNR